MNNIRGRGENESAPGGAKSPPSAANQAEDLVLGGELLPPPYWILGPDVIEAEDLTLKIAESIAELRREHSLSLFFKASYEKANRSSRSSYRGPGLEQGLALLDRIRTEFELPVTSDIHSESQVGPASEVLDLIQIPAFLCRQNSLLEAVSQTGRIVNLKKGQFLSPWDLESRVSVLREAGAKQIFVTERGTSFGYHRLVNDFRMVPLARATGARVIFDATHSVQTPGGPAGVSGGEREFIPVLARAAAAAGVDGFFFEVHPEPSRALCDGDNALPLDQLPKLLPQLIQLNKLATSFERLEIER